MSYALLRKDGCAKIASERLALIDRLLIEGIRIGSVSKRRAINKVLREFPEFTRGDCWQRIRYLRKNPGAGSLRVCQCDRVTSVSKTGPNRRPVARQWTEADDDKLLNLAGYERVDKIAQRLSRSVRAVRFRLCALGMSGKVSDGWSLGALRKLLRVSPDRLRDFIGKGIRCNWACWGCVIRVLLPLPWRSSATKMLPLSLQWPLKGSQQRPQRSAKRTPGSERQIFSE